MMISGRSLGAFFLTSFRASLNVNYLRSLRLRPFFAVEYLGLYLVQRLKLALIDYARCHRTAPTQVSAGVYVDSI